MPCQRLLIPNNSGNRSGKLIVLAQGADVHSGRPTYDHRTDLPAGRDLPHVLLHFFASKEDLILEIIYYQQPLLLAYAEKLVQGSLAELGRSPKTLPVHLLPWRTQQDRPFDDH